MPTGPYAKTQALMADIAAEAYANRKHDWFDTYKGRTEQLDIIWRHVQADCYKESTELEIVDDVYGYYASMAGGIETVVSQKDESVFVKVFEELRRSRNMNRKLAAWQVLDRKLQPYSGNYPIVSSLAFEQLFVEGTRRRNFSICLGMITQLQDPHLAREFLNRISQAQRDPSKPLQLDMGSAASWGSESAMETEVMEETDDAFRRHVGLGTAPLTPQEVYAALRGHTITDARMRLRMASTGVLGAFSAGRVLARPEGGFSTNEIRRTIIRPLGKIAMMPPVAVRLLYEARDGKPLDLLRSTAEKLEAAPSAVNSGDLSVDPA